MLLSINFTKFNKNCERPQTCKIKSTKIISLLCCVCSPGVPTINESSYIEQNNIIKYNKTNNIIKYNKINNRIIK